jgi:hypothetical protein
MHAIPRKSSSRAALIATAVLGTAALSGCATYPYGYDGYTSVSVHSSGPGTYGYRNGYRPAPYWGWRGDYYYPGVGVYVYDRDRNRHRWNDDDRHYWEGRRSGWGDDHHYNRGRRNEAHGNWDDFHH